MENDTHQLLQTLRDGDISTRCRSAKALAERPASDVSAGLIRALSDDNYLVRGEAARALGMLRPTDATRGGCLLKLGWCLRALGMLRPTDATSHLKRALVDSHPFVRREAGRALAKLGPEKDTADQLKRELVDLEPLVRREAARALGILGSADAADHLKRALVDMEPLVRAQAADALTKLEWRPSTPSEWAKFLFATGLDWQHPEMTEEVKNEVITLLLGFPDAIQRVNLLLEVPSANIQNDLLRRHFGKWGFERTIHLLCLDRVRHGVPALIELLRYFNTQELHETIQALFELKTYTAVDVLTDLLKDNIRSSCGISSESFSAAIKMFSVMVNRLRSFGPVWHGEGPRLMKNVRSMICVIEDGLSSPKSASFLQSDIQYLATIEDAGYMGPDGFPGPCPIECMYSLKEIRNRAANVLAKRL